MLGWATCETVEDTMHESSYPRSRSHVLYTVWRIKDSLFPSREAPWTTVCFVEPGLTFENRES